MPQTIAVSLVEDLPICDNSEHVFRGEDTSRAGSRHLERGRPGDIWNLSLMTTDHQSLAIRQIWPTRLLFFFKLLDSESEKHRRTGTGPANTTSRSRREPKKTAFPPPARRSRCSLRRVKVQDHRIIDLRVTYGAGTGVHPSGRRTVS